MSAYDDNITGNANCVAYWTLDGSVNDSEGTNHLSGGTAGTYVEGPFGYDQAMSFNGTTQSISSGSAIDLTGTNKVTLIGWFRFEDYDLTNTESLVEFSIAPAANAGSIALMPAGAAANDPFSSFIRGDVGNSQADYYPSNFGWRAGVWYNIAIVGDFSLSTNEVYTYLNGILMTPDARPANQNNGANFGNYALFLASRNNASRFCNCSIAKVSLFNTALTVQQIVKIYSLGVNSRKSYMKLDSSLKLRD